jgi:hypothetical protein
MFRSNMTILRYYSCNALKLLHYISCKHILKLSHYTPRRRFGEEYSSYSFSTSALDRGEWSASRPGCALSPGKGPPVPIGQVAGWAPEPVWTQRLEEKSFHLCRGSNLDRTVIQPDTILTELRGSLLYN